MQRFYWMSSCHAGHARIKGEPYVLLDRSLHEVVKHIAKDLTGKIRLSWPVETIEYSEAGAVVYGPGGARIKCAHVLVSMWACCRWSLSHVKQLWSADLRL